MRTCHNNPKKSSTTTVNKHTTSGYSLFTCCSFDATKITQNRSKNCMKNFCLDLREQVTKIIDYEKKEMILLTEKQVCHICKKGFSTNDNNTAPNKENLKVRDHCHYTGKYRGAAHEICNLRYKTPKETPVVFHNDYHFIIKELARKNLRDNNLNVWEKIQKNILHFPYQLKSKLEK